MYWISNSLHEQALSLLKVNEIQCRKLAYKLMCKQNLSAIFGGTLAQNNMFTSVQKIYSLFTQLK